MTDRFERFPAVEAPKNRRPEWNDLLTLMQHEPSVRYAVNAYQRSGWTREEALIAAVFWLYEQKRQFWKLAIDNINCQPTAHVVFPPEAK